MPLFKAKKYQEFLSVLEKITAGNEAVAQQFVGWKFAALCNSGDFDAGLELGEKLFKEHHDHPNVLDTMFGRVIDPEINPSPAPAVIDLALKASKRAVQLSGEKNPSHLDTLALAQYLGGHPFAAVATEEKAIKALEPGPHPERKAYNERLQRYRKAAAEMKK